MNMKKLNHKLSCGYYEYMNKLNYKLSCGYYKNEL